MGIWTDAGPITAGQGSGDRGAGMGQVVGLNNPAEANETGLQIEVDFIVIR